MPDKRTARAGPASFKRARLSGATKSYRYAPTPKRMEVKATESEISGGSITNAGTITRFGTIDAGDGDGQRNGRSVKTLRAEVRIRLVKNIASTWVNFRVIVFAWKQAQSPPFVASILGGTVNITSGYNQSQVDNYKILSDDTINFPSYGVAAGVNDSRMLARKLPYSRLQGYSGISNGSVNDWAFYHLLITDQAVASLAEVSTMVYFVDA